jgi:phage terminase large subunit-like protein
MIPAKLIVDKRSMPGVPNALSNLLVRHVSGGVSSIGFKSYKQGKESFYGTAIDVAWCDEEPLDLQIYSEIVTRTMTTDGIVYTTSTPLAGMTPFVESFEKHADFIGDSHPCISRDFYIDPDGKTSKAIIRGGWDHVPWLSEDAKREILAATPENLRDARSKGIPAVGEQNVYALTWDQISVPSFPIPEHYRCWYGLDVGGNTAACFFAEDPDTSTIYLYDEYVGKQQPPVIHAYAIKERGAWMHGAVDPHAGDTNSSGEKVLEIYRNLGLNLRKANNAVEGGLTEVWNLLSVGKLKIFDRCRQLRGEYSKYRRDKDGKVVKKDDHLMDAMRYGIVTGRRLAERQPGKGAVNGRAKSRYDAIR